jgi:uncharacterized membrane protein (UPF0136 family)
MFDASICKTLACSGLNLFYICSRLGLQDKSITIVFALFLSVVLIGLFQLHTETVFLMIWLVGHNPTHVTPAKYAGSILTVGGLAALFWATVKVQAPFAGATFGSLSFRSGLQDKLITIGFALFLSVVLIGPFQLHTKTGLLMIWFLGHNPTHIAPARYAENILTIGGLAALFWETMKEVQAPFAGVTFGSLSFCSVGSKIHGEKVCETSENNDFDFSIFLIISSPSIKTSQHTLSHRYSQSRVSNNQNCVPSSLV